MTFTPTSPADVAAQAQQLIAQGPPADDTPAENEPADNSKTVQGLTEARDRYRAERDTVTQERDTLVERLAVLQRAEIERLASVAGMTHPSDLFTLSGNELADYLTEAGEVDPARVAKDAEAIFTERPGLRRREAPIDMSQGHGNGNPQSKREPTWGDLVSQSRKR